MTKFKHKFEGKSSLIALMVLIFICLTGSSCNLKTEGEPEPDLQHNIVFYQDSIFAGWPANGGLWIWDNEILVCFTRAEHMDRPGIFHTFNKSTARNMFARSLDGGNTWTIEDAYQQGITGFAHDHQLEDEAIPPKNLEKPIDFLHPDFALLFQNESYHRGPSHFYYTYDRGKSWNGPFDFPKLDTQGIGARTDYIIDGRHEMLVFLTTAKNDNREGRIACFRTIDGGQSWNRVAWIGPEPPGFSIMPSSVRLSDSEILTVIRHRNESGQGQLISFLSRDNALTWQQLDDPVDYNIGSPPALIQLPDGELVLVYAARSGSGDGSSICAKSSLDGGHTWSNEIVLREKDGANADIGYTRVIQRPDGKLVITYYWNHALQEDKPPYRYIAATIWDPENKEPLVNDF